jgi:hypothetical protein
LSLCCLIWQAEDARVPRALANVARRKTLVTDLHLHFTFRIKSCPCKWRALENQMSYFPCTLGAIFSKQTARGAAGFDGGINGCRNLCKA